MVKVVHVELQMTKKKLGHKMFEQHRALKTIKPLHPNQMAPNSSARTGVALSMRSRVMFKSQGKRELDKHGLVP